MQIETTTESKPNGHPVPLTKDIATRPQGRVRLRKGLFAGAMAAIPAAVGTGVGMLAKSKRAGALAGGLAAGALALARWQLERYFSDEPAYEVEERLGDIEIRRYAPHVIARTTIAHDSFEAAQQDGFRRLARYIFSENIPMTSPVEMAREEEGYSMAFVMPPGRPAVSLPRPTDMRTRIVEVPERRIAVLKYRGRYSEELVEKRQRELLTKVANAGLSAKGRPMFAGYDAPSTAPFLRRTEAWIEII